MLKAGLRFPLSSLHHKLLKYLGLSINLVFLCSLRTILEKNVCLKLPDLWYKNADKAFIAMEVLYDAMSNGARRLTVREFLHCYRPNEIEKSRGIYSFVPRSPLLKVIFKTPNSNRDWKSRYFFLEGDEWMCHLEDTEHMPVDTTWGILPPSSIHPS